MPTSHKTSDSSVLPRRGPKPSADKREKEELVTDFFGAGNQYAVLAGMHPQSKRVSDLVGTFMDKIQGGPEERILGEVQANWKEIANDDESILKLRAVRLVRGTMTIEVPDATLLYVFQQPRLKSLLLERIGKFSQGEVRQLRIVVKGR